MDPLLLRGGNLLDHHDEMERRLRALEATRRVYDLYSPHFGPGPGKTMRYGNFSGTSTSSATFETLWQAPVPTIAFSAFALSSYVLAAVGDTAEFRLVFTDSFGSSISSVGSAVGNALFQFIGVEWLHQRPLWSGEALLELQARRSSGTTDLVTLYYPQATLRDPSEAQTNPTWIVTP